MDKGPNKVFGRFNILDFAFFLVAVFAAAGFLLARAGHAGVNSAIKGTGPVDIVVYFAGVKTLDTDLFKVGETSALTIRNVPVQPPMRIKSVKHNPKQMAFLAPDGKKVLSFDDPTQPVAHDFEVVVTDTADRTDDGYVIRGNKLKVGNQVELESFKYRVSGVVVDVYPAK